MDSVISEPGIYDIPELEYHADSLLTDNFGPSLSSTGAKNLLDPSTPAQFRHIRDNGRPDKAEFDLGHAVHAKVLGVGLDLAIIPEGILGAGGSKSTKAAKEFIAEARARGAVPVTQDVVDQVDAIAEQVMAHPAARSILAVGAPERSAYAIDEQTGVTMRARIDWLRDEAAVDLKTTRAGGSHPAAFGKTCKDYGYHVQAAWYLRVLAALGMTDLPFVHIVVETEPPYLVAVHQLDDLALSIGDRLTTEALETYARCVTEDVWPGRSSEIETVSLPSYYTRAFEGAFT